MEKNWHKVLGNCIISNHRLKEEVKQEEIREIKVEISLWRDLTTLMHGMERNCLKLR